MKTRTHTVIPSLAVALLLWCPATAWAQPAPSFAGSEPRAGEQLVVTYVTDRFGPLANSYRRTVHIEFLMMDGGRLVGRDGDRYFSVDTRSIRSVRRRIGTKPASAPAMALGSAAGFAAGFVMGAVSHPRRLDASGGQSAVNRGLSAGVLVGAPLGALVAWVASRSRPIYEDVQIGRARPSVAMSLSGRVRLSVSIATQ